jgi:membrane protease YdiL (CAAX protease family)
LEESTQSVTPISLDHLIAVVGVGILATWLLSTSLGRRALADSRPRRNRLAPYMPFIPFVVWIGGIAAMQIGVEWFMGSPGGWRRQFLDQIILGTANLATAALILIMAQLSFAQGLKGFGLRLRTVPKDAAIGFVNLLAVWPPVVAVVLITTQLTRFFVGPQFEMPRHQGIDMVTESTVVSLQVIVIIGAVVIAPVLEELLFRGLFQTTLRSYSERPWLSIFVTSLIFASVHENVTHWPALFVLAVGMGYAYEKSGSLWRPIFMHALFNGLTLLAAWTEQSNGAAS